MPLQHTASSTGSASRRGLPPTTVPGVGRQEEATDKPLPGASRPQPRLGGSVWGCQGLGAAGGEAGPKKGGPVGSSSVAPGDPRVTVSRGPASPGGAAVVLGARLPGPLARLCSGSGEGGPCVMTSTTDSHVKWRQEEMQGGRGGPAPCGGGAARTLAPTEPPHGRLGLPSPGEPAGRSGTALQGSGGPVGGLEAGPLP